MQHQDWQERIPFYIAKTLTPEEHRAFEQHLATCPTCHQEVKAWRKIAAAVWQEADSAAKSVPPLSQAVYSRLQYRGHAPTGQDNSHPITPDYVPRQAVIPAQRQTETRKFTIPITMVAGIVVAFLFGAFLLTLAMRVPDEKLAANQIALNATGTAESFAASQDIADNTRTPLPTNANGNGGLLPTPVPFATNTAIPTPSPLPPPQQTGGFGGGGGIEEININPTSLPPPTQEPEIASVMAGIGPYITLTPNQMENGTFACYLFNPTNVPIDGYTQASYASAIKGEVRPGSSYRTLVRSMEGWYQVVIGSGIWMWIPPETAYLQGNCDASMFWIPTPTVSAQATSVIANPNGEVFPTAGDTYAVVEAAFANFYSGPGFNFETINVTERGSTFQIVAYSIQGGERWLQVLMPDGQLRWLWGEVVSEYNQSDLPQNP